MKYLLALPLLTCALFASEERINIDLDSSWKLIQNQEGERVFKVWEKGNERIILVATPWSDERESIQEGLDNNRALLPESAKLTVHEQSETEALIEIEYPDQAKVLSKLIYTPKASCIIGRSYTGEDTDSVAISEWTTFLNEHVQLEMR